MSAHRHPVDGLTDDLVGLFARGRQRLELAATAGLRRGLDPNRLGTPGQRAGDATAAYRQRQLTQARAVLDELAGHARRLGPIAVGRTYGAGLLAVDRTVGPAATLTGEFGRVHVGAVEVIAANLTRSLETAVATTGANLELAFARAGELEGALAPEGAGGALPRNFIGRRTNDPYRQVALEQIGAGIVGLETRREISAGLARRLVDEGITDALTGYVDRAGRRWPLEHYASMVVRTTTREATTRATVNRLLEGGQDLVTISRHAHPHDECSPYEGRTFSLTGRDDRYPKLDKLTPFHPFCVHVTTPAGVGFEDFERELGIASVEPAPPPAPAPEPTRRPRPKPAPPAPPPSAPPRPGPAAGAARAALDRGGDPRLAGLLETEGPGPASPFGGPPRPRIYDDTPDRLAIQRAIDNDPGPDPEAFESLVAELDRDHRRKVRELNKRLSPELRGELKRKWATEQDLRGRLLRGEVTVEEVEQEAYENAMEEESRRAMREAQRDANYGLESRPLPCFSCGKLKRRPADVCAYCGDDPVPATNANSANRAERNAFNKAYGYVQDDRMDDVNRDRGYRGR